MSATYDPTIRTDLDFIRSQIGDRNVTPATNAFLSDEEIDAIRSQHGNRELAAAACGDLIASRSKGLVEKQVGDLRLDFGKGSARSAYGEHLDRLREQGAQLLLPTQSHFRIL